MKKGFTLVELLAVLTLLGLVVIISLPAIINRVNNHEQKISEALSKTFYAAANIYIENNLEEFDTSTTHHIKLSTLVKEDLLDSSSISEYHDYCVKVSYESNQYTYEMETSCVEG